MIGTSDRIYILNALTSHALRCTKRGNVVCAWTHRSIDLMTCAQACARLGTMIDPDRASEPEYAMPTGNDGAGAECAAQA